MILIINDSLRLPYTLTIAYPETLKIFRIYLVLDKNSLDKKHIIMVKLYLIYNNTANLLLFKIKDLKNVGRNSMKKSK